MRINVNATADAFLAKIREMGCTQAEISKITGLNQSRISRITTKSFVRLSQRQLRAFEILGIEPVYLAQKNHPSDRTEIHKVLHDFLAAEPHLESRLLRFLKAGLELRKG